MATTPPDHFFGNSFKTDLGEVSFKQFDEAHREAVARSMGIPKPLMGTVGTATFSTTKACAKAWWDAVKDQVCVAPIEPRVMVHKVKGALVWEDGQIVWKRVRLGPFRMRLVWGGSE